MPRCQLFGLSFATLAAMALLTVFVHQHQAERRRSAHQLHDWDFSQLVAHLNRRGVDVRLQTVSKTGPARYSAFLTSTTKEWHDLNALSKDPRHIHQWRGTLYCEWVDDSDVEHLLGQWGEHCLEIRPCLFYGDAELLDQVRSALEILAAAPESRLLHLRELHLLAPTVRCPGRH
jgi:hypothetical protein